MVYGVASVQLSILYLRCHLVAYDLWRRGAVFQFSI